ncbi:hypothetical protein [Tunicatimonas pelagia]|uniref:hypothetical protein n=1 Tax=Tunicatimonas pelagia TaxID=931531 RepID=UPI002666FC75|nr:hypothetical protein [Tunicatimonas pelagia]WKN40695.1 hypothetical protein P0M28_16780 [Tunicatimonas pelagia]
MPIYKYASRLQYMDQLIRLGTTGSATEFANKLDISVSQLKYYLRSMRDLGAPIAYCHSRRGYYYQREGKFLVKFLDKPTKPYSRK